MVCILFRRSCLRASALGLIAAAGAASAQTSATTGSISGTITDSLNSRVLRGAIVHLEPSTRQVIAGPLGEFRMDSVPAGTYRVRVLHPVLDTLGVALVTPQFSVAAGGLLPLDIAVPPASRLIGVFCSAP